MTNMDATHTAADQLARLYSQAFGGKPNGRYRLAAKLLRNLLQRRRIYADDVEALSRALFERGYVLIDMDSFYVVMSANSFVNYRRANEEILFGAAADERSD